MIVQYHLYPQKDAEEMSSPSVVHAHHALFERNILPRSSALLCSPLLCHLIFCTFISGSRWVQTDDADALNQPHPATVCSVLECGAPNKTLHFLCSGMNLCQRPWLAAASAWRGFVTAMNVLRWDRRWETCRRHWR